MGFDEAGRALYFAEFQWHYACIVEGSSSVVFTDDSEKTLTSNEFWFKALRFDPSDFNDTTLSGIDVGPRKDPTGPLFWRKLRPSEDPSLQSLIEEPFYNYIKANVISVLDECARDAASLRSRMNQGEGDKSTRRT